MGGSLRGFIIEERAGLGKNVDHPPIHPPSDGAASDASIAAVEPNAQAGPRSLSAMV